MILLQSLQVILTNLSAEIDNPFASFVETITEQSQVAPWITDPEIISLIAEATAEGRTVSDASGKQLTGIKHTMKVKENG